MPQTHAPWIDSDGTWSPAAKPVVQGRVAWPQAKYTVTLDGAHRTLTTNDLPVGGNTGVFPVMTSDPASMYDSNPNRITPHVMTLTVDATPVSRDVPACLPLGPVGVLSNGVVLYDALDRSGRDAVAHEVQDACGGHPDDHGVYHYHSVNSCLAAMAPIPAISPDHAALAGYAVDGFGIYVERDAAGTLLTNTDLDACHGRISWVPWDGRIALMYHYDVTAEYPYTIGCLRGTGSGNAWDNHDANT